mmetsp:Transcript_47450/g.128035  ORF Transcript_47450/g.128035 Transcript_47450/m.128035 type:complete len:571 (+) Transcript_47450:71-1783(+)
MPAPAAFAAHIFAAIAIPACVHARTELVQRKGTLRATVDKDLFYSNLRDALGDTLGCGEDVPDKRKEKLAAIEKKLLPIWNSLPKSASGRIERPLLRYIAHRYFVGTSSIMIRGFERSLQPNQSFVGSADILSQQVPAYLEAALESQHAQEHGFDLHDAVHMVAMLRKLISDSDAALLEKVYEAQRKSTARPLTRVGLEQVLHEYMVHWLLGDDAESIQIFLEDKYRLDAAFPRWSEITGLQVGEIKAFDFERGRARAGMALSGYSFSDAQEIVGRITSSFASFWDDECSDMRDKLIDMDKHHTGRVPLSRFYSKRLSAEWRFAESEDYLRELGALDETSRWHGKEVIIPNYIGAASNCIVATPHYLVCCMDSCEGILGELEAGINAAVAAPAEILALVMNMSSQTSVDDEEPPKLEGSLSRQLDEIASAHGGKVPLHGRLFAQWLHYAFPRECPFPHRSGATSQKAPSEFGDYVVSEHDRRKHADAQLEVPVEVQKEDTQWMSQWSSEEELQSEYAMDLRAPWEVRPVAGAVAVLLLVAAGVTGAFGWSANSKASGSLLPQRQGKAHFI